MRSSGCQILAGHREIDTVQNTVLGKLIVEVVARIPAVYRDNTWAYHRDFTMTIPEAGHTFVVTATLLFKSNDINSLVV